MADRWSMFAHNQGWGLTNPGPRPYVELHGLPDPIVEVEVVLVADGDPAATHWGWLKSGGETPSMIWPSWACYSTCFPYGPEAEEKAGRGRTVRLAVNVIEGADHG